MTSVVGLIAAYGSTYKDYDASIDTSTTGNANATCAIFANWY